MLIFQNFEQKHFFTEDQKKNVGEGLCRQPSNKILIPGKKNQIPNFF